MNKVKISLILILACLFFSCKQQEELIALDEEIVVEEKIEEQGEVETSPLDVIYIHICGSIKNPGVYAVVPDARVVDVVNAAGGLLEDAEVTGVNLAKELTDGMQIIIPSSSVNEPLEDSDNEGKVNLNTASESELCTLPNIGASRAVEIIAYREEHGGFQSIDEIMQISGIKEGIYQDLKDFIYVP